MIQQKASDESKRVLVIAFHSPPKNSSASNRIRCLLDHLPDYGWTPKVLTRDWEGPIREKYEGSIVQTPYPGDIDDILRNATPFINDEYNPEVSRYINGESNKKTVFQQYLSEGLSRMKSLLLETAAYPDIQRLWKSYAVAQGKSLINQDGFNAILSTSPPATDHLIAYTLAEEFDLPWIADFRDLWTQYHYNEHNPVREFFETRLQRRVIDNADHITAATDPFASKLEDFHDISSSNIHIGYSKTGSRPVTDDFTVTYTGGLSGGKRNPEPLFKALGELEMEGSVELSDVSVKFIGDNSRWLKKLTSRYQMNDVVELQEWLPKNEVIEVQRESQILLSIQWDHPMEWMVCPGKIFDYLAAQRPILAYGGPKNSVVNSILEETSTGVKVSNKEELKYELKHGYQQYKKTGEVPYYGDIQIIKKYSQREMAKKFSRILDLISS